MSFTGSGATQFAVGTQGRFLVRPGTKWTDLTKSLSPKNSLDDIWGSSPTDVWAVTNGAAYHFDGKQWTFVAGAPRAAASPVPTGGPTPAPRWSVASSWMTTCFPSPAR